MSRSHFATTSGINSAGTFFALNFQTHGLHHPTLPICLQRLYGYSSVVDVSATFCIISIDSLLPTPLKARNKAFVC
jgi:hypothetical protein